MQEGCRDKPHKTVCVWVGRYDTGRVLRLEYAIEKIRKIASGDPEHSLKLYDMRMYIIELTRDNHLLFYIWRDNSLDPKERIWHYILSEESAELLRRKMEAVETIKDFWALVQELKKAAKKFYRFRELLAEEARRRGLLGIGNYWKFVEEMKEKVGYCRDGGICIENDATYYYPYSVLDEYLYPS